MDPAWRSLKRGASFGWSSWLLLFVCAPGMAQSRSDELQSALHRAERLYRDGQYRQASETLSQHNEAWSSDQTASRQVAEYLRLLSQLEYASGRCQSALVAGERYQETLRRLARVNPDELEVPLRDMALHMSDVYLELGQFAAARQALDSARPSTVGTDLPRRLAEVRRLVKLAELQRREGNAKPAEVTLRRASLLANEIRLAASQSNASAALRKDAELLVPQVLLQLRRAGEAVPYVNDALQKSTSDIPRRITLLITLAQCQAQLEQHEQQGATLQQALRLQQQRDADKPSAEQGALWFQLGQARCELDRQSADGRQAVQSAARIYEQLAAATVSTDPERVARIAACQQLQDIYQWLQQWEDAIRVTTRLLEYRRESLVADDPSIYRTLTTLGTLHARRHQYQAAAAPLRESVAFWRRRTPLARDPFASAANQLAEVLRATGHFSESLSLFQEVLAVRQQERKPRVIEQARAHANVAVVLAAKGRYQEAAQHYNQARALCDSPSVAQQHDAREVLSFTLLNQAMLAKSQLQLKAAVEYCERGLQVRQDMPQTDPVDLIPYYNAMVSLQLAQAAADNSPSETTSPDSSDRIPRAAQLARQSLAIGQQHQVGPALTAEARYLLGRVLYLQKEWAEAEHEWRQGLEEVRGTGDRELEARLLGFLAKIPLGELAALPAVTRPTSEEEWPAYEAAVRQDRQKRYEQLHRSDAQLQEAIGLHRTLEAYPSLQFIALVDRAQLQRTLSRICLDWSAVERSESTTDNREPGNRGLALRQEADLARLAARQALKEAVTLIEAPRASTTGAEGDRAEFFSQYVVAFDLLVEWSVADGEFKDAIQYADNSRNRTFLDQIRTAGIDLRHSLRDTPQSHLLTREDELLEQYTKVRHEILAAASGQSPPEQRESLVRELVRAREEYANIQNAIRDASPFYREVLRQRNQQDALSVLQTDLPRENACVLRYYLGRTQGHLFLMTPQETEIHHFHLTYSPPGVEKPIPLSSAVATRLVHQYLQVIRDREQAGAFLRSAPETVTSARDEMQPAHAVALTEGLLPSQARRVLADAAPTRIIAIPDGALHQLPLEALLLRAEPPEYVLDALPPISYAPSAMIMAALKNRTGAKVNTPVSVLTIGNPQYPNQRLPGLARQWGAFSDFVALGGQLTMLPMTETECADVAEAWESSGARPVDRLLGRQATEEKLRGLAEGRAILHIAAHGLIDQQHENLFGAIALTPGSSGQARDDGLLSLYEIHQLPLAQCQLAILSACQTNVGPERPLEVGSTMARAFLAAGAHRVVASHWSVDDRSTAQLVATFVQQLTQVDDAGPVDYARALQIARQRVRQDPRWGSPFHWAPLVLIGPALNVTNRETGRPATDSVDR